MFEDAAPKEKRGTTVSLQVMQCHIVENGGAKGCVDLDDIDQLHIVNDVPITGALRTYEIPTIKSVIAGAAWAEMSLFRSAPRTSAIAFCHTHLRVTRYGKRVDVRKGVAS